LKEYEKENVIVQASDEVSYDTQIKSETKNQNRATYNVRQMCEIIDDVIGRTGRSNLSILEIGFSTGEYLRELSKIYPDAKFIGLEVRKKPVERMVALGYDCRLVETELFDEFFKAGEQFDIIYGFSVLHHISDPYKSLESVMRILKAGGVVTFIREAHRFDLLSFLYYTYKWSWQYEKYTLKMSRKRFKKLLGKYASDFYVKYDNFGLMLCFKRLNAIYCKLKMQKVPLWNGMTIYARKMKD